MQANPLAVTAAPRARNHVHNVAVGGRTSLIELFQALRDTLAEHGVGYEHAIVRRDFRPGDVRRSQADIGKGRSLLGYAPSLEQSLQHYPRVYLPSARG